MKKMLFVYNPNAGKGLLRPKVSVHIQSECGNRGIKTKVIRCIGYFCKSRI